MTTTYVLSVEADDEDEATEYVASLLGTEPLPWGTEVPEPRCVLCDAPLYGSIRVHHHNDPETSDSLDPDDLSAGRGHLVYIREQDQQLYYDTARSLGEA
jgi:hypothetical protein